MHYQVWLMKIILLILTAAFLYLTIYSIVSVVLSQNFLIGGYKIIKYPK